MTLRFPRFGDSLGLSRASYHRSPANKILVDEDAKERTPKQRCLISKARPVFLKLSVTTAASALVVIRVSERTNLLWKLLIKCPHNNYPRRRSSRQLVARRRCYDPL